MIKQKNSTVANQKKTDRLTKGEEKEQNEEGAKRCEKSKRNFCEADYNFHPNLDARQFTEGMPLVTVWLMGCRP